MPLARPTPLDLRLCARIGMRLARATRASKPHLVCAAGAASGPVPGAGAAAALAAASQPSGNARAGALALLLVGFAWIALSLLPAAAQASAAGKLSKGCGAVVSAAPAAGQRPPRPAGAQPPPAATDDLDADTLYQLLLAEFKLRQRDAGGAHSLMLDAAQRLRRPELFRRAVEMALQGRAGNSAYNAALDWGRAFPDSDEPLRFQLQILLALNRAAETGPVLQRLIALTSPARRNEVIAAAGATLGRLSDQAAARQAAALALQDAIAQAPHAAAAHAALGRLELLHGRFAPALAAAQQALGASAESVHGALLALELLQRGRLEAQVPLRAWLERPGPGTPAEQVQGVHLAYAQALIELRRISDAQRELRHLTARAPDFAPAWLLQGLLQTQSRRPGPAQAALLRFLELAPQLPTEQAARGRAHAYLHLAQLAEQRRDFNAAQAWLERADPALAGLSLPIRRAHLLAHQGQIDAARALLRQQAERDDADARRKLVAEAQLLRELGQYQAALEVYGQALQRFADDPDLLYEKALTAKRAGQYEAMEQMLRLLMARHPDYHHAYNALGYSLADRNLRLDEARSLILKALAVDPDDAYILDSLGWVEFRLGNHAEALRLLLKAFERLPDAEIAAHLGEVHWVLSQREQALAVWRAGLALNPDNRTLLETLRRLQVQP